MSDVKEFNEADYLRECLRDRFWRLNNLYKIMTDDGEKITFQMRKEQYYYIREMHNKNIILKARQLGFTTGAILFMFDVVMWYPNRNCGFIAQGLTESSDIFNKKVLYAYENLPEVIQIERPLMKRDGGEIIVDHGNGDRSSLKVGTSMRSATMHYMHISEYGKTCAKYPDKAKEIRTGALNAGPKCVVTIESTAEGNYGDFHDKCRLAHRNQQIESPLTPLDYKFFFFPWFLHPEYRLEIPDGESVPDYINDQFDELAPVIMQEHGVEVDHEQRYWYYKKSLEQGEEMKREFPNTVDEAFEMTDEGNYYREQINQAYRDKRITDIEYNPTYPVHTAWDIGHRDATAIWFFQIYGGYFYMIDYYEKSGKTLEYFADYIKEKPYEYGQHIGPHDIDQTEWGAGKTRKEQALDDHDIRFETAPKLGISEGIDQVRRIFQFCIFDKVKCQGGLNALTGYHKEKDEKRGIWSDRPAHDKSCHGADAFRYMAVSGIENHYSNIGNNLVDEGAI